MDETSLEASAIALTADVALADMVAQSCPKLEVDAAEGDRRRDLLAAEVAKTYEFQPDAVERSPIMQRLKEFETDPALQRLVAREMANTSRELEMHPDDPASLCRGGEAAVEQGSRFGLMLKPRV